ncbi:MAG: hypothetical protein ACLR0N_06195 [Bilophila wadsworthia]
MATAGIKAAAYCLNFAPELALHYGGTPAQERKSKPDSEFLRALPEHAQTYEEAQAYAPNKTYIGAMSIDELEKAPAPWIDNLGTPERFGTFGEIMPAIPGSWTSATFFHLVGRRLRRLRSENSNP